MSEVRVTGLNVYPIKSCGGIEQDEAKITPSGLEYDRLFMLIDKKGKFISQRNRPNGPSLVNVRPSFGTYNAPIEGSLNGRLNVRVEGFGEIDISLFLPPHHRDDDKLPQNVRRTPLDLVEAKIHKSSAVGAVVSTEANTFFSEYLGEEVRLIRAIGSNLRQIEENRQIDGASPFAGFADGYPLLLASEASLRELNAHPAVVAEFGEAGVGIDRFRANIEVDGNELEPYDEDFWRKIKIGQGLSAFVVKPCVRCVIPQTDQQTGEISEAVKTVLMQTRKGIELNQDNKGTFFGQNLVHAKGSGRIAVGDVVTIVERSDVPNVVK